MKILKKWAPIGLLIIIVVLFILLIYCLSNLEKIKNPIVLACIAVLTLVGLVFRTYFDIKSKVYKTKWLIVAIDFINLIILLKVIKLEVIDPKPIDINVIINRGRLSRNLSLIASISLFIRQSLEFKMFKTNKSDENVL